MASEDDDDYTAIMNIANYTELLEDIEEKTVRRKLNLN